MQFNFDAIFRDPSTSSKKIPKEVIENLSQSLPEGLCYKKNSKEVYVVTTMDGDEPFTLTDIKLELNEDQKRILGNDCSEDQIRFYVYNSQESIKLNTAPDGYCHTKNGSIPKEDMFVPASLTDEITDFDVEIIPTPFPDPQEIKISTNNYTRNFNLQRKPIQSLKEIKLTTEDNNPLQFIFFLNIISNDCHIEIHVDIHKAQSINEIVEMLSFYQDLFKNKILVNGIEFNALQDRQENLEDVSNQLEFWKMVLQIQEVLQINFFVPEGDVTDQEVYLVRRLFNSLILNCPNKDPQPIETITFPESFFPKEELDELIMYLKLNNVLGITDTENFELFGRKFSLPVLICSFNAQLKKLGYSDHNMTIELEDLNDENKKFSSSRVFLTRKALNDFIEKNSTPEVDSFHTAEFVK